MNRAKGEKIFYFTMAAVSILWLCIDASYPLVYGASYFFAFFTIIFVLFFTGSIFIPVVRVNKDTISLNPFVFRKSIIISRNEIKSIESIDKKNISTIEITLKSGNVIVFNPFWNSREMMRLILEFLKKSIMQLR